VALRLYDVSGRLVRTLVRGPMAAGVHRATWDGRDDGGRSVGSGVYFVRYDALGGVRTQRILRLR
jgi:flagellar hook assembly protein FlgD